MSKPAWGDDATATQPPPSVVEIQELVRNTALNLAERNRAITNAYHRISEAMRAKLDAGPNLDWCGFAKWSSHTVGLNFEPDGTGARASEQASMLVERLPRILRFVRPIVETLLKRFIDVEDGLVSKALRGGNGSIFVEMGSIEISWHHWTRTIWRTSQPLLWSRGSSTIFAPGTITCTGRS